jgi:Zn-dependent peptidase ImmA (M78 family)
MSPHEVRVLLGEDFSHDLPERVTEKLDVDVLVLDLTGDGYTVVVDGHSAVVVKRTTSWFRQNFSIAHELAHLAAGSLCDVALSGSDATEESANAFAAELLLPEAQLRSLDWAQIELPVLAERLWHWGVSTQALAVRLKSLHLVSHAGVTEALANKTQTVLRRHWPMPPGPDLITRRMDRAAERRLPLELVSRVEIAVLDGRAPAASLAFAMDVPEADLDLDLPPLADPDGDLSLLEGLI